MSIGNSGKRTEQATTERNDRDSTSATRTVGIVIRAEEATKQNDGTFLIIVGGAPLRPQHIELLRELYPNLMGQAYNLLNKELILQSIVSED